MTPDAYAETTEPTTHTLAARIAGQELGVLNMLRRIQKLDRGEWAARCDEALDEAIDVATLAVWAHTDPQDAAAEFCGVPRGA